MTNKALEIIIDVTLIIQSDEATENFDDELKDTAFCFNGSENINNVELNS